MRIIPLAALTILVAGPLAGQGVVGRNERIFTLSESVSQGGWVRIATFNGQINITQGSSNRVEIRAEKDIRRGDIEDIGFLVRRENGGITICAVRDDEDTCDADGGYRSGNRSRDWYRNHQGQANFTVQIPSGVRVRAGSGNGDVRIAGGGAEVIAATGNGRVDVNGTTGQVRASTGNGDVAVQDARGPVDASTGSGNVRVVTSSGPVSASSGNGDIDVSIGKLDRSPDMSFSTGNGRVTLSLPDGFGAEVDANTGNGTVSSDFPVKMRSGRLDPSRLRGTIGDGGGRLSISSGNGDVKIRREP
jgi:DUF4097 and DUF4098 domain-containing protein YvlB